MGLLCATTKDDQSLILEMFLYTSIQQIEIKCLDNLSYKCSQDIVRQSTKTESSITFAMFLLLLFLESIARHQRKMKYCEINRIMPI